uniref:Putative small heat shock protein n=1 Tax=Bemisia tabaci TaxID=7038 RepID=Q86NK3_BEMTA|nr:putative small heat shock protein [Bemisia tabaci]
MTIFYNEPREFNFPIEFFFDGETPAKRNCMPSTSRARLDLIEHESSYEARVELAGYKKEEIELSIHDHKLTVKATKPAEQTNEKTEKPRYLINERNTASTTSRTWKLPEHITEDNIHAAYDNGLLTLRYSRHAPESEPKKVQIH